MKSKIKISEFFETILTTYVIKKFETAFDASWPVCRNSDF